MRKIFPQIEKLPSQWNGSFFMKLSNQSFVLFDPYRLIQPKVFQLLYPSIQHTSSGTYDLQDTENTDTFCVLSLRACLNLRLVRAWQLFHHSCLFNSFLLIAIIGSLNDMPFLG
jgi:hypothetical protein